MFENPSADKFGPPPAPSEPRAEGRLRRWLIGMAFGLEVYVAHWLWTGSRGPTWLAAIVLFALGVFDFVIRLHNKDDKTDPYSPPTHITR